MRFISVDKPYYDGHLDNYRHLDALTGSVRADSLVGGCNDGRCVSEPDGNGTLRLNLTAFPDMAAVWELGWWGYQDWEGERW